MSKSLLVCAMLAMSIATVVAAKRTSLYAGINLLTNANAIGFTATAPSPIKSNEQCLDDPGIMLGMHDLRG